MRNPPAHPEDRKHLDQQRRLLPEEPGVYVYSDIEGNVLYVGKAKSLNKRVNSYFTKSHDSKTHALVMRIANIEIFSVSSEREALDFENNLIKRHRPPFNIMLRDDKSYPYIAVTTNDEYPRVLFTRERHRKGVRYFGPYASARRVRETLDLLNRVFPYRPCEGSKPGRQSGIPCLDFHIERCSGPCIKAISADDYGAMIATVMDVLEGKTGAAHASLVQNMQEASAALEFERAARIRNRLNDLETIKQLQAMEQPGTGSFDVVGVAVGEACANVQVLQVRDGRLADRSSHYLDNVEGQKPGTVAEQFMLQWYDKRAVPPLIVIDQSSVTDEDAARIAEEIATHRSEGGIEVRRAQRGEKRRLAALALRNADHALTYDTLRERQRTERREQGMEQLRDMLDLESLPVRIECYDISNLMEKAPVASMVVLEDGTPRPAHYRSFSIRYDGGQDDFAMMAEVMTRRFRHLTVEDESDESFGAVPNLVVIDGGKGQLSAAVGALANLGVQRVAICSLAKREEEIFIPGQSESIVLPARSPALQLLQRVRDEAHRFAVGRHRARRRVGMHESILDQIEGIGPARRSALLNFFGSPDRVVTASLDELESVPGLPGKVARSIYDQLHRMGSRSDIYRLPSKEPRR